MEGPEKRMDMGKLQVQGRIPSSAILCHVALVRTDVLEEPIASIIRMIRNGELGTLAVTSNQSMLCRNTRQYIPPKHQFLQDPHGVTPQRMTSSESPL
jgi:hypothetical protein